MTCRQPPRPLGQFLVSYVRNFKRDHPDIKIVMPYEHTASGLFEVTDAGVLTTYETGTAMIVDLWDRYPESAFRELSLDPKDSRGRRLITGAVRLYGPVSPHGFTSDPHGSGKAAGPSLVASGRWRGTS